MTELEIMGLKVPFRMEKVSGGRINYLGVSIGSVVNELGVECPQDVTNKVIEHFKRTEGYFGAIDWWYQPQRDV